MRFAIILATVLFAVPQIAHDAAKWAECVSPWIERELHISEADHPLPAEQQRVTPKPNILFLLSDDHSYPFLSTYGDANVRTPVLDQLAAEGMKFHRFFTAAPQCVPSRAAMMTGRSPVAARMTRFSAPLPREEITLPELLRKKAGYFTGVCGRSFHLDGSAKNGNAIGDIFQKNHLKTFVDRVDSLNTCSDNEVAGQLYDLDADPSELKNLSGAPEYTEIERELRTALAEKMILDFDYLPLPNLMDTEPPAARKQVKRKAIP